MLPRGLLYSALRCVAAGCHSYHVETTVMNRPEQRFNCWKWIIRAPALEPGLLAAGAEFHYRIQLRGSGPVKVQYTTPTRTRFKPMAPRSPNRRKDYWKSYFCPEVFGGIQHLQSAAAARLNPIVDFRARGQQTRAKTGARIIHFQPLDRFSGAVHNGRFHMVGGIRPSNASTIQENRAQIFISGFHSRSRCLTGCSDR